MMNKIRTFLIVAFLCSLSCWGLFAQSAKTYKWTSENVKVERSGDGKKLDVSFSVNPKHKIASQEIVYIYPTLLGEDDLKVDLEPFCIVGKERAKVIKRSQVLKNKLDLPLVKETYSAKFTSLSIVRTIPFERWMAKSRLILREEVYGCAECEKQKLERTLYETHIHLFSPGDYRYDFIEPKAVTVKRYEENFESKVNFEVARHELKRNYKGNATELTRLDNFVQSALSLEGTTLDVVRVEGYASPEGGEQSNQILSERRADVLANYVRNKFPEIKRVPEFKVKGFGSDWAGLRSMMKESDHSFKDQVIEALDLNADHIDKRNALLKIEGGKVYEYLLSDLYPSLRRTTFRMGYQVRPFTIEELPRIFGKKPQLLSNHEHYLLAKLHMKDGKNPLPIFESAARIYPGDVVAVLNYANAILKYDSKRAKEISNILRPFKDDLRTALPLAIAENMLGNERAAEAILEEAAKKGCKEAQRILGQ